MKGKKKATKKDHHFHKHFCNGNHVHRRKTSSKYVVIKWWQFSQQFFLLFYFTRYRVIQFSDAIQRRKKIIVYCFRKRTSYFFLSIQKLALFSFTLLQTEKCQKTFSILTKFVKKNLNLSLFQHFHFFCFRSFFSLSFFDSRF